ncbi:unnamed protein product [Medioppia subpectinata]|uniref:Uncharacterized protein n=1 Tax=Medioppia subpectinata TaxID=1979941 RepID=A0A7R9L1Z9_9ACAR|nr:unnamed protein product [Medioppia subpectinata]CAG2113872.1 unnamed protein product [Medioppia subpectinata]
MDLQLIALFADYWAYFDAKSDLGLPEEVGHYGLWGLCSVKAPVYRDDCDPLDTFFKPPHHMMIAGAVASIHTIVLGLFLPFIAIRLQQIRRNKPNFIIDTKTVNKLKLLLITFAVFLSTLTLLLMTIQTSASREQLIFNNSPVENYDIRNGWSFWLEVTVLVVNVLIIGLCLVEMNRIRKLDALGFTAFIANPGPDIMSHDFSPNFESLSNEYTNQISIISDPSTDGWNRCNQHNCQLLNKTFPNLPFQSIAFNNPAFLPESPDLRRHKPFNNHFEII